MSLCQPVIWSMAAIKLRDSTVVVVVAAVVHTRSRAIPLATITMRKSTHGFPFLSHILVAYGAPLLVAIYGNTNNYYISVSLWKIWLDESILSIPNSLWTWHDKCNICCRYYIYLVKFNVCLVTKPPGVFSETQWLNASLLFLRMNYVQNV